jgi:uracil-DNA glycosylase family 4
MTFPQEILPQLISYLEMLERRGIKSLYLSPPSGEGEGNGGAAIKTDKKKPKASGSSKKLSHCEAEAKECVKCPLHETRTQVVFGVGDPRAKLMFIGEAPGRDEDRLGEPFVGRAGKLLTKILEAVDLTREEVYITNILKCRPPDNRDPVESEVRCCEQYLKNQIELIKPRLICALGRISAQWLLRTNEPLSKLRMEEHDYEGIPVVVTYHPAALLRNPQWKRGTWEDFKKLIKMLEAV